MPFVKRRKNDAADAEAIAEAAAQPTMRFVAPKSEAQQAAAMAYRTRDLLVRQRTQTITALRAHLAEYGVVAPIGVAHVSRLVAVVEGEGSGLPEAVMALARMLVGRNAALSGQIETLDLKLRQRAGGDDTTRRLMTIPGVGAITASAITTFAPPRETFAKGRDFAAWAGLTRRASTRVAARSGLALMRNERVYRDPDLHHDRLRQWARRPAGDGQASNADHGGSDGSRIHSAVPAAHAQRGPRRRGTRELRDRSVVASVPRHRGGELHLPRHGLRIQDQRASRGEGARARKAAAVLPVVQRLDSGIV